MRVVVVMNDEMKERLGVFKRAAEICAGKPVVVLASQFNDVRELYGTCGGDLSRVLPAHEPMSQLPQEPGEPVRVCHHECQAEDLAHMIAAIETAEGCEF